MVQEASHQLGFGLYDSELGVARFFSGHCKSEKRILLE